MRPSTGPFRPPPAGRLVVRATRDDAFGAELLFVVEGLSAPAGVRLAGSLRGPDCSRATTLPVTMPLLPATSPGGVAARAVLTEPAPWTPELPNRYRLEARLEGGDALDESSRRPFGGWIGLRRLGRRGRSFRLDGRRFVLRGGPALVAAEAAGAIAAVRARHHAVVVDADFTADAGETFERMLDEADRDGVFVVVNFDAVHAASIAAITSFHPSAGFVIARDREAADAFAPLRAPSGPLSGLVVDGEAPPPNDVGPADFLVVRLPPGELPHAAWLANPPPLPLVACGVGSVGGVGGVGSEESATCDALQAALARWAVERAGPVLPWDWSGYLVGPEFAG